MKPFIPSKHLLEATLLRKEGFSKAVSPTQFNVLVFISFAPAVSFAQEGIKPHS